MKPSMSNKGMTVNVCLLSWVLNFPGALAPLGSYCPLGFGGVEGHIGPVNGDDGLEESLSPAEVGDQGILWHSKLSPLYRLQQAALAPILWPSSCGPSPHAAQPWQSHWRGQRFCRSPPLSSSTKVCTAFLNCCSLHSVNLL